MLNQGKVDFLIIGTQKSGTTSLFKYLSEHPAIFMPRQKEIEFFSDDNNYMQGSEWYLKKHFGQSGRNTKLGEASTHYMMYSYVPERIHKTFPDVKLIALLRNPIDRAYSHYRMAVRRNIEHRSFKNSIIDGIAQGVIEDTKIDHNSCYVQFGEYGRILNNYLKYFDKDQIYICFTENLKCDSLRVLKGLFQFIQVDERFIPLNSNKIYHQSGDQIIPGLTQRVKQFIHFLRRQRALSPLLWKVDFNALFFWLDTQFNIKRKDDPGPTKDVRSLLLKHYFADVLLLEQNFNIEVPWKEFKVR